MIGHASLGKTSATGLNNQSAFRLVGRFTSKTFYFCLIVIPKIGKADDSGEIMERKASDLLLITVDHHIFSVQAQICVLTGNKEGVQKLSYPTSSNRSLIYAAALRCRSILGRQSSFMEQALQALVGLTRGVCPLCQSSRI